MGLRPSLCRAFYLEQSSSLFEQKSEDVDDDEAHPATFDVAPTTNTGMKKQMLNFVRLIKNRAQLGPINNFFVAIMSDCLHESKCELA
jgi:hypothetical protein